MRVDGINGLSQASDSKRKNNLSHEGDHFYFHTAFVGRWY